MLVKVSWANRTASAAGRRAAGGRNRRKVADTGQDKHLGGAQATPADTLLPCGQRHPNIGTQQIKGGASQAAGNANRKAQGLMLARGLGWFSVGLGLTEIFAPRALARFIGAKPNDTLLRAYGLREMAAGLGLLTQADPAVWVQARVAGDVMDLTTMGAAFPSSGAGQNRLAAATAAVVGITALDVLCAAQLSGQHGAARDSGATVVEKSVTVGRAPEELLAFWRDPARIGQIVGDWAEVTPDGQGGAHWKVNAPLGRAVEWDAHVHEERPGELLRWHGKSGTQMPVEMALRFCPAEGNRGTEVTLWLRLAPSGVGGSLLAHLPGLVPATLALKALRAFKSLVETGEIPTLAHNPSARKEANA